MDNFRIPSLWRGKSPQICGERTAGAGYSNTATASEPQRPGPEGAVEALEGLGEGFRRGWTVSREPGSGSWKPSGTPSGRTSGKPWATQKGAWGTLRGFPRRPFGAYRERVPVVRQPFLMRLVSSVTWL